MERSPAAETARFVSEKQICDLADTDLCAIFKRLPPADRLIVSEVCRQFYALSRKEWLDVTYLDLSPIPGKHIGAIVRQCPNLRSVYAISKSFKPNELACLFSVKCQLSTLKFWDCIFTVAGNGDGFAKIFSENLQHASLEEIVVRDAWVESLDIISWLEFTATYLPASLSRLQLSNLRVSEKIDYFFGVNAGPFLESLDRLENLECLILNGRLEQGGTTDELIHEALIYHETIARICTLKNLRELCIGPAYQSPRQDIIGRLVNSLPKLEVLFLNDVDGTHLQADLAEIITKNSVLRILVLTGRFYKMHSAGPPYRIFDIPARKRFPYGFGSDPLPLLHVFVGKGASEQIRFATSTKQTTVEIYPISEPLPRFLERKDIAPIFDGVWVAEKIKETARNSGRLWQYEIVDTASNVQRYTEV